MCMYTRSYDSGATASICRLWSRIVLHDLVEGDWTLLPHSRRGTRRFLPVLSPTAASGTNRHGLLHPPTPDCSPLVSPLGGRELWLTNEGHSSASSPPPRASGWQLAELIVEGEPGGIDMRAVRPRRYCPIQQALRTTIVQKTRKRTRNGFRHPLSGRVACRARGPGEDHLRFTTNSSELLRLLGNANGLGTRQLVRSPGRPSWRTSEFPAFELTLACRRRGQRLRRHVSGIIV